MNNVSEMDNDVIQGSTKNILSPNYLDVNLNIPKGVEIPQVKPSTENNVVKSGKPTEKKIQGLDSSLVSGDISNQFAKKAEETESTNFENSELAPYADYMSTIPKQELNFIKSSVAKSLKPEETLDKMLSADAYAKKYNLTFQDAYTQLPALYKKETGEEPTKKTSYFKQAYNSFKVGAILSNLDPLMEKYRQYYMSGDTESANQIAEQINALKEETAQYDTGQDNTSLRGMSLGGFSSLYPSTKLMAKSFGYGMGVAGGVELLSAVSGVSLVNPIAGGITLGALLTAGTTAGVYKTSMENEKNSAFFDMTQNGVDPNIASKFSDIDGIVNGLTESLFGFPSIVATKISKNIFKNEVKKQLKTDMLSGYFIPLLKKVGKDSVSEISQEEIQLLAQHVSEGIAYRLSDVENPDTLLPTINEVVNTAVSTLVSTSIMGLPLNAMDSTTSIANAKQIVSLSKITPSAEVLKKKVGEINPELKNKNDFNETIQELHDKNYVDTGNGNIDIDNSVIRSHISAKEELDPYASNSGVIKRLSTGELRTFDKVILPASKSNDESETHEMTFHDPAISSRYGVVGYKIDKDNKNIDIEDVKVGSKYEPIREEMVSEISRQYPSYNITWSAPKTDVLQKVKDNVISTNTRGSENGLNTYDLDDTEIPDTTLVEKQYEKGNPNINKAQVKVASILFSANAKMKGISVKDQINKYFNNGEMYGNPKDINNKDNNLRGATVFTKQGKAILYSFEHGDVSTTIHETAHALITPDVQVNINKSFKSAVTEDEKSFKSYLDERKEIFKSTGMTNDEIVDMVKNLDENLNDEKVKEFTASSLEGYMSDGVAPTKSLSGIFKQLKNWFTQIYKTVSHETQLNPKIKAEFDALFTGNKYSVNNTETTSNVKSDEVNETKEDKEFFHIENTNKNITHPLKLDFNNNSFDGRGYVTNKNLKGKLFSREEALNYARNNNFDGVVIRNIKYGKQSITQYNVLNKDEDIFEKNDDILFQKDLDYNPKKVGHGYKLFEQNIKTGELSPLFISQKYIEENGKLRKAKRYSFYTPEFDKYIHSEEFQDWLNSHSASERDKLLSIEKKKANEYRKLNNLKKSDMPIIDDNSADEGYWEDGAKEIPISKDDHDWYIADNPGKTPMFALRPGWHIGSSIPDAPWLKGYDGSPTGIYNSKKGKKFQRVWAKVSYPLDIDYQPEADKTSSKDIKGHIPKDGSYLFRETNGTWVISGALRIDGILTDKERTKIMEDAGYNEAKEFEAHPSTASKKKNWLKKHPEYLSKDNLTPQGKDNQEILGQIHLDEDNQDLKALLNEAVKFDSWEEYRDGVIDDEKFNSKVFGIDNFWFYQVWSQANKKDIDEKMARDLFSEQIDEAYINTSDIEKDALEKEEKIREWIDSYTIANEIEERSQAFQEEEEKDNSFISNLDKDKSMMSKFIKDLSTEYNNDKSEMKGRIDEELNTELKGIIINYADSKIIHNSDLDTFLSVIKESPRYYRDLYADIEKDSSLKPKVVDDYVKETDLNIVDNSSDLEDKDTLASDISDKELSDSVLNGNEKYNGIAEKKYKESSQTIDTLEKENKENETEKEKIKKDLTPREIEQLNLINKIKDGLTKPLKGIDKRVETYKTISIRERENLLVDSLNKLLNNDKTRDIKFPEEHTKESNMKELNKDKDSYIINEIGSILYSMQEETGIEYTQDKRFSNKDSIAKAFSELNRQLAKVYKQQNSLFEQIDTTKSNNKKVLEDLADKAQKHQVFLNKIMRQKDTKNNVLTKQLKETKEKLASIRRSQYILRDEAVLLNKIEMKEKQKLKDEARKVKEYKRKLAIGIMRKPSKNVHWEEAKQITDLQSTFDPNFRRGSIVLSNKKRIKIDEAKEYWDTLNDEQRLKEFGLKNYNRLSKNNLSEMTLDDLEELSFKVKSLRSIGLAKRRTELEYERLVANNALNKMLATMKEISDKKGLTNKFFSSGSVEEKKKAHSIKEFAHLVLYSTMNQDRISQTLDGDKKGIFHKVLVEEKRTQQNIEWNNIDRRMKPIQNLMKEYDIDMKDLYVKHEFDFNGKTSTYTNSDLLYTFLAKYEPRNYNAVAYGNLVSITEKAKIKENYNYLKENGTKSQIAEAKEDAILKIQKLGDERFNLLYDKASEVLNGNVGLQKLAVAIQEDFNSSSNRINNMAHKIYNQAIQMANMYLPIKRTDVVYNSLEDSMQDDLLSSSKQSFVVTPKHGFTKDRIDINPMNQSSIDMDLFGMWSRSVNDQEHWLAFAELGKKWNRIFNSYGGKELKNYIINNFGTSIWDISKEYMDLVINPTNLESAKPMNKIIKKLRGNLYPAYLGFKVSPIVLQAITSPAPFMSDLNPIELSEGYFELTKNPDTIAMINEKSPMMRHREMHPLMEMLKESASSITDKELIQLYHKGLKVGMMGESLIDKYAVSGGWLAMYKKSYASAYQEGIDSNLSEEEAQNYAETSAIKSADNLVLKVQPTGDLTELSSAFRNKSEAIRAILQFQTALNTIWQNVTYDIPQMMRHGEYSRAMGMTISYMIAGSVLYAVTTGFNDNDDDKDKIAKLIFGAFTQFSDSVPLFGSMITTIIDNILTNDKKLLWDNTPLSPMYNVLNGINSMSTGTIDGNSDKFKTGMKNFFTGIGNLEGIPTSAIKEYKDAFTERDPTVLLGR